MIRYAIKVTVHSHELYFGVNNQKLSYFGSPLTDEKIKKYGYKTERGAQFNLNWHKQNTNYPVDLVKLEVAE